MRERLVFVLFIVLQLGPLLAAIFQNKFFFSFLSPLALLVFHTYKSSGHHVAYDMLHTGSKHMSKAGKSARGTVTLKNVLQYKLFFSIKQCHNLKLHCLYGPYAKAYLSCIKCPKMKQELSAVLSKRDTSHLSCITS